MLFFSRQKLFSFSRYLNFCPDLLVMQENGLIRNTRLILKSLTSQLAQQTIAIHLLTNISRSKDNQATKFGRLIEYNQKNIFLEKSFRKCGGEITPRHFFQKSKLSISLDQNFKFLYILFLLFDKLRIIKRFKLSCRPLAFTSNKAF